MSAPSPSSSPHSRTTLGLVLIAIGLILTLDSAGVMNNGGIARWWPLLLIGTGYVKVRRPRQDGQRAVGVALLLVGGFFQLTSLLAFSPTWPMLMVAAGGFLLWQGIEGPLPAEGMLISESPYLSEMAFIGHLKRNHTGDFRGGWITAVMGGVELDLRKAALRNGTAYMDVVAFWGGIEIKVPAGWTVDSRIVPMMGAAENKVDPLAAASGGARLVVRGHAIMGAVVIGS